MVSDFNEFFRVRSFKVDLNEGFILVELNQNNKIFIRTDSDLISIIIRVGQTATLGWNTELFGCKSQHGLIVQVSIVDLGYVFVFECNFHNELLMNYIC